MNPKVRLLLLWLAFIPLGGSAQGINDILRALRSPGSYAADAVVTVDAPGADQGVEQTVRLRWSAVLTDTVTPCRYIIDASTGPSHAFSALLPTTLYRYDGRKLSEYTAEAGTLTPQLCRGMAGATLLPHYIADEIEAACANPYTEVATHLTPEADALIVELTTRVGGEVQQQRTYTLRKPDLRPIHIRSVSSADTPMQTVMEATITPLDNEAATVDTGLLMQLHGDVISRFSSANVRPENYVGYPMPPFTLPDTGCGRYTFNAGNATLLILVDPEADPDILEHERLTAEAVRSAEPELNSVDFIYIVRQRRLDAVRATDGSSPRQRTLLGGEGLMRTLGARSLPLIIAIDAEGNVIATGSELNNETLKFVIDKD